MEGPERVSFILVGFNFGLVVEGPIQIDLKVCDKFILGFESLFKIEFHACGNFIA